MSAAQWATLRKLTANVLALSSVVGAITITPELHVLECLRCGAKLERPRARIEACWQGIDFEFELGLDGPSE